MKPRILALADGQAPSDARAVLAQVQKAVGMVPNLHRTLAHAPAALRAYVSMAGALGGGVLPPALREQIAVATAATNGCSYCASAHTALGQLAGVDAEELSSNLRGEASDPRTAAALAFAKRLVEARGAVTDADLRAVREAGFSDAEVVEIIAHVGLNTFTNIFNVAARTEIDFPVVDLEQACCRS